MKKNIGEFYDKLYSSQEVVFGGGKPIDIVTKIPKYITSGKVLDIGRGEGWNAFYLAEKEFEVEVIDISKVAIEKISAEAEKKDLNIKTQNVDIQKLELKDSYDSIVSSFMLHQLTREKAIELIEEMKAHTNVSGLNIIATFTKEGDFFKMNTSTDLFYPEPEEIKNFYSDWKILEYEEKESKAQQTKSDGTPMINTTAKLIAQKIEHESGNAN